MDDRIQDDRIYEMSQRDLVISETSSELIESYLEKPGTSKTTILMEIPVKMADNIDSA